MLNPLQNHHKIYLYVIGPDGAPLPTDTSGRVVDSAGSAYPTSREGLLIGPDGSPLPTNAEGAFIVGADGRRPEEEAKAKTLPTDESGRAIYPVVGADSGELLPTDAEGRFVNAQGDYIPTDEYGRPMDERTGQVLPTDNLGQYVYVEVRSSVHRVKVFP